MLKMLGWTKKDTVETIACCVIAGTAAWVYTMIKDKIDSKFNN